MTDRTKIRPLYLTVQQHILEGQRKHPHATGQFSWLLSGITLATKIIQSEVSRAGLADILGHTGEKNIQGEEVQKLDEFANSILIQCLGCRENISLLVSEENEEPLAIHEGDPQAKYIVLFDPLDGSSNIDVNVSIGTIFSILQRDPKSEEKNPSATVLQPGYKQVAAGYVVYGGSTVMAYTSGDGVHMFTLEPSIGAYLLAQENVRMPASGKTYSVNEAYSRSFPPSYQRYLDWTKNPEAGYTGRYIGSLVADFHRTLVRGGVFLYPPTAKSPNGKLRLLYEANPLAFLAEQAGGMATDGHQPILQKEPENLHERTPLIIGSKEEVERVMEFVREEERVEV